MSKFVVTLAKYFVIASLHWVKREISKNVKVCSDFS
jgi:hypothetical protein